MMMSRTGATTPEVTGATATGRREAATSSFVVPSIET